MLIYTYGHNMHSYDSDNKALLLTKELVVQTTTAFFAPVPLFGGEITPFIL